MVEYLYNAIRATIGSDIEIVARITEEDGTPITCDCKLIFYDEAGTVLDEADGNYTDNGYWRFFIPAEATEGKEKGRYFYCINNLSKSLCFKTPIYFM